MSDFDFGKYLDEIGGSDELPPAATSTNKIQHPCNECAGTGKLNMGYRLSNGGIKKCFACRGRGFFLTSSHSRKKAKQARVTKLSDTKDAFMAEHEELVLKLVSFSTWNSFARSLMSSFEMYGGLTDKQIAAPNNLVIKIEESRSIKRGYDQVENISVDISSIREMFDRAGGSSNSKYRAEGLVISRAPDSGRNKGYLYVQTDKMEYLGKIDEANNFMPVGKDIDAAKGLASIAKNPKEAAMAWGVKTGRCSCCGKTLTDPQSIAAGIGPVCAGRWF